MTQQVMKSNDPKLAEATELICQIYRCVSRLEELFKDQGRKFTPDGHLVGSIGEVLAAAHYGLSLFPPSHPVHDGISETGDLPVQIKISQTRTVGLRSLPEHLLVLALAKNGTFSEIYNGTGKPAWDAAGDMQKNGQRSIGFTRLKKLMPQGAPIPRRK